MKIALLGASGQLGSEFLKHFTRHSDITPYTRKTFDITDFQKAQQALKQDKPGIVINCTAYNRVDDAETNTEKAFLINAFSVENLAKICADLDIPLVHFSTDYVFGKDFKHKKPYTESSKPGPLNIYGKSKLKGEELIKQNCSKHFIIRTAGLYCLSGNNFVKTMLRFAKEKDEIKVVDDQITAPTWTQDIIDLLHGIITSENYGFYHITPKGETSWYNFAQEIFKITGAKVKCVPCTTKEYPLSAKRPAYSVLESTKTAPKRTWQESLNACLKTL